MRAGVVFLFFARLCLQAEIIDRVAVSIDGGVITQSELLRQIRITAFLNGEEPDFSGDNKGQTADRLIEQMLIRREIQNTRYVAGENTGEAYKRFRQSRFPKDQDYQRALAKAGLTDEDVQAAFNWQETLLRFVELRFRPGVQLSEAELRDYYRDQFVPEVKAKGQTPPSFEDARDAVEQVLLSQRVDNALDRWLGQVRTQTRIRYRNEVLR